VLQSRQGRTKNFNPDTAEKRHHFNPDNAGHGITSVQTKQYFSPDKALQGSPSVQTRQDKNFNPVRQDKTEKNINLEQYIHGRPSVSPYKEDKG
jgi:hypothetical protein